LQSRICFLDSAMGTMLQKAGLRSGHELGELWNTDENSGKVLAVHQANVAAGSDIIITNTFGANRFKLAHYGVADQLARINREGACLARKAAGNTAFVAGDLGPTGEILEQWGGNVAASQVRESFAEQAAALAEGGADCFILETFMDLEELKLALESVKGAADLPVVASMTFQQSAGQLRTMWGLTPREAAEQLTAAGADIVGSNCGLGSDEMVRVVREMARGTKLPIAAQPNAGAPELRGGETVYPETPEYMARKARELVSAGAGLIGCCCGSTPECIAAARAELLT